MNGTRSKSKTKGSKGKSKTKSSSSSKVPVETKNPIDPPIDPPIDLPIVENPTETVVPKPSKWNIFLANCIWLFHTCVILFVLFAPLTDIPYFLILHATFCVSLIVHWYGNSNVCSLSVLESKLRGLEYTESFTHQFIGPVYEVSQTSWSYVCWVVTISLLCVSVYKIYRSPRWKTVMECYYKISDNISDITIRDKIKIWAQCVQIMFT